MIVNISNGKQKNKDWPRGSSGLSGTIPRFKAGTASATVVVAPVSGTVSTNPPNINCSQPTQLAWTSSETIDADMSGMSPVPTSGEKTVSPRQTTAYELTATGPGGVTKSSATVGVNTVVQSSLGASPIEVRSDGTGGHYAELVVVKLRRCFTYSVWLRGRQRNKVDQPRANADRPVDEEFKYTLTATNACGGSDTKTVSVRLKGSIEPIPAVLLKSVFYPT